jgi:quinol monooxygenase YgiN
MNSYVYLYKGEHMYGLTGKLLAQPGKRAEFVEILLRAADTVGQMPGCHLYLVNEDLSDDVTIWVMEVWEDQAAHDASLKDERVRSQIAAAMPLMGEAPSGRVLKVIGGHGLKVKP